MKEELFKTLVTFITPSSEAGAKSLELILRHIKNSVFKHGTRNFSDQGKFVGVRPLS